MRTAASLLILLSMLAGCGGAEEEPVTEPPPTETGDAGPTTEPGETTAPPTSLSLEDLGDEDRTIVESAIADLAERAGAEPEEVRLVSFEHVTWSDGSLGCPEPGKMYTQALVEGSRTVLELDGMTYDYHAGSDGEPFWCESPSPSGSVPSARK